MKLKDWLESKCISVPKFCKYNEFCEESIYAYTKGSVPRASIALKIVKATGGQVSLEDLGLDQEAIEKIQLNNKSSETRKSGKMPEILTEREKFPTPCSRHPGVSSLKSSLLHFIHYSF